MATLIPSTNVDNTANLIQNLSSKTTSNPTFSAAPVQQPAGTTGIASSSVAQPGFFGWLGNAWDGITGFFNSLGNRAQQIGNNIAGLNTTPAAATPVNNATTVASPTVVTPNAADSAIAVTNTLNNSPVNAVSNTGEAVPLPLGNYLYTTTNPSAINTINATQTNNQNLFGWSNDTWNNINKAAQIGQFGWNTYADWKQMQMAEAALAEQQAMNAFNRNLSTFNTNTQIEQANQSLRDRLYARQKYETGSTEGAEQLYKERELQKFRG